MASTPTPTPTPTSSSEPTNKPIPIKIAARNKLPVKRKTPDPNPNLIHIYNLNNPNSIPKIETATNDDDLLEDDPPDDFNPPPPPPPFKFHRIWPESDEIRFLQTLLDSTKDGLIFPRDLQLFYLRFSQSMIPQPSYTKSQLSEKLRRLRKKFRVISTRISRGLEFSLLTPHDQSLFSLSKQLWGEDSSYPSSTSPFLSLNNNKKKNNSSSSTGVTVRVRANNNNLSPNPSTIPQFVGDCDDEDDEIEINNDDSNVDCGRKKEELNLENVGGNGNVNGKIAAKTVMDVFDRSLKDVRMVLVRRGLLYPDPNSTITTTSSCTTGDSSKQEKTADHLMKRFREQRVTELDVLARRLRLVLEHALHHR